MGDGAQQLLADMARVQALYVLRVFRETGRPPEELLATQTPWQCQLPAAGPAWPDFLLRGIEILWPRDTASATEPERAERFVAFAGPLFAQGPLADVAAQARLRWFGCFRFVEHPKQNAISLHMANRCAPRSPFEDLGRCFRWLRDLCAAAGALPFAVRTVTCGSWLNDRPDFLRLFPASYAANLKLSSPDGKTGGGWWGQLVDRRGCLHRGRATQLLETGQFPHPRKESGCEFAEFKAHVEAGAGDATARMD